LGAQAERGQDETKQIKPNRTLAHVGSSAQPHRVVIGKGPEDFSPGCTEEKVGWLMYPRNRSPARPAIDESPVYSYPV